MHMSNLIYSSTGLWSCKSSKNCLARTRKIQAAWQLKQFISSSSWSHSLQWDLWRMWHRAELSLNTFISPSNHYSNNAHVLNYHCPRGISQDQHIIRNSVLNWHFIFDLALHWTHNKEVRFFLKGKSSVRIIVMTHIHSWKQSNLPRFCTGPAFQLMNSEDSEPFWFQSC
jgi:hypothetical protein